MHGYRKPDWLLLLPNVTQLLTEWRLTANHNGIPAWCVPIANQQSRWHQLAIKRRGRQMVHRFVISEKENKRLRNAGVLGGNWSVNGFWPSPECYTCAYANCDSKNTAFVVAFLPSYSIEYTRRERDRRRSRNNADLRSFLRWHFGNCTFVTMVEWNVRMVALKSIDCC